jgi:integrase
LLLRDAAGLPLLTFHGLRPGFGSLLAAQGVHPRAAMELMGHSQIDLTMEMYTHVAPELAHEAASKIGDILGKRS